MRRPAAELLIRPDAIGKHAFIVSGEIRFLCPGDVYGRRLIHVDPSLSVGAHERLGHVRFEPVTGRRKTGKTAGSNLFADLGHDKTDTIVLQ
jgi:hypothetical protein